MVHVVNRREKEAKKNGKKAQKAVNGKEPSILCAKALSFSVIFFFFSFQRTFISRNDYDWDVRMKVFFFPIISLTLNWLFLCLCCCSFFSFTAYDTYIKSIRKTSKSLEMSFFFSCRFKSANANNLETNGSKEISFIYSHFFWGCVETKIIKCTC